MIRFVLMVNKQGQTRLAQYYETHKMDERCALEAEVIRKCLSRIETQVTRALAACPGSQCTPGLRTDCAPQCSFYEYRGYKVVYRRYASLFFIMGVEGEDEVCTGRAQGDCDAHATHDPIVASERAGGARVHPRSSRDARPLLRKCRAILPRLPCRILDSLLFTGLVPLTSTTARAVRSASSISCSTLRRLISYSTR